MDDRGLTVVSGRPASAADEAALAELARQIAAAAAAAGHPEPTEVLLRSDRTSWRWRPAGLVPVVEVVRAARAVAERLNPGHWRIEADDRP